MTRSPRSPRASPSPSRSPAKRKNITPVLQATRTEANRSPFLYLFLYFFISVYFFISLFLYFFISLFLYFFIHFIYLFYFILFYFILPHTNNITITLQSIIRGISPRLGEMLLVLIKRRKEEEKMMTIVARRPKRNYKAYVS